MTEPSPTIEQWRALYAAANKFYRIAPWEWMLDSDVFGVLNPVTSEIGYCAVLGRRREVFALVVYLGTEGLRVHQKVQSGEISREDDEAMFAQQCLMASFEHRSALEKEDLSIIKELGLTFRGANAWPQFRSYRPGFVPWFLTQTETVFLSFALEQSVDVCLRFKDNLDLLTPHEEGQYLVRVQGPDFVWKDKWLRPVPLKEEPVPEPAHIDEVLLARVRKATKERRGIWEGDVFYAPAAIRDKDRPYYPRTVLWIDRGSGFALSTDMFGPSESASQKLIEQFLNAADMFKVLPTTLAVKRKSIRDALEPVASWLGIDVSLERDLCILENFKSGLFDSLRRK
jgi:hypothetical protein